MTDEQIMMLEQEVRDLRYKFITTAEENTRLRRTIEELAHEPYEVVRATRGQVGNMSRKAILNLLPWMVARSHHTKVLLKLERAREALIKIRDYEAEKSAPPDYYIGDSMAFDAVREIAKEALEPEPSSSDASYSQAWR